MRCVSAAKILVTNDDGIDSVGLHVLARSLVGLGDVMVVAPDREFSGAGAAIGALHEMTPEVHEVTIDGIPTAFSVSGSPALCVFFARLGAFGPAPDLVVSGINPGANVGRSVYHSGTVGACLTARNGGISGIAISQSVADYGVEGQGWEKMLKNQKWGTAATVAATAAEAVLNDMPATAGVLNLNVPNVDLEDLNGWVWTEVGSAPPRAMSKATLNPKPGHTGSYRVDLDWGDQVTTPDGTDTAAVMNGQVAATWLSRLSAVAPNHPATDRALNELLQ